MNLGHQQANKRDTKRQFQNEGKKSNGEVVDVEDIVDEEVGDDCGTTELPILMGNPKSWDSQYSTRRVVPRLQSRTAGLSPSSFPSASFVLFSLSFFLFSPLTSPFPTTALGALRETTASSHPAPPRTAPLHEASPARAKKDVRYRYAGLPKTTIMAKCPASRLTPALGEVVGSYQTCCVLGRSVQLHGFALRDLLTWAEQRQLPTFACSFDQGGLLIAWPTPSCSRHWSGRAWPQVSSTWCARCTVSQGRKLWTRCRRILGQLTFTAVC